jgi:uncharacterized protein YigA (DUF484 family)
MSNQQASSKSTDNLDAVHENIGAENTNITPEQIVAYLSERPDFFLNYPEVLAQLHVHHQNKGVVSLTQLQIQQYRDTIKTQKRQLDSIVSNAKRNETIYTTYAELNLAVVKTQSFTELESVLNQTLKDALGLSKVFIYLFDAPDTLADKIMPELQQRAFLDKKLNADGFYFGRLGQNEKQLLFPNEQAASVALVSIGESKPMALMAIASDDALHFTPDMDTMLLQYLRDFLSFHLPKLLAQ